MKYTDIPKKIRDELIYDEFVFGNAFCLMENGKYIRIDPMKVMLKSNGEFKILRTWKPKK